MQFLPWLPPKIRQQTLEAIKDQVAVKFPAAYFGRVPQNKSAHWMNLTTMDSNGMIIKTAPDGLVAGLIETCEKYQLEFEVIEL